jgi:hypothetical protein
MSEHLHFIVEHFDDFVSSDPSFTTEVIKRIE